MHNKPYYGDKQTAGTYRGQAKASTKTFFAYATLLVVRKGQTYTVGLLSMVNGEDLNRVIDQLLAQAASSGLRPRRLLLDRGFYAGKVMLHLQQKSLPFVMPMIRRGKSGKTRNDCTGTAQFFVKGRRGWAKYRWEVRVREGGLKGKRTHIVTDAKKGKRHPWSLPARG
jgi:putative transposase